MEADAPLALQRDEALVEDAHEDEMLVDCNDRVGVDVRIECRVERAVVAEDANDVGVVGVRRGRRARRRWRGGLYGHGAAPTLLKLRPGRHGISGLRVARGDHREVAAADARRLRGLRDVSVVTREHPLDVALLELREHAIARARKR